MSKKNFHASKPNYFPATLERLESLGSEGKYLQVKRMVLKRSDGTLYGYETLEKSSPAVILPITSK
jgi:hypothetical protein